MNRTFGFARHLALTLLGSAIAAISQAQNPAMPNNAAVWPPHRRVGTPPRRLRSRAAFTPTSSVRQALKRARLEGWGAKLA